MSFPVMAQQMKGQFCASVIGAPELRYVGPSRDAAIAGLRTEELPSGPGFTTSRLIG